MTAIERFHKKISLPPVGAAAPGARAPPPANLNSRCCCCCADSARRGCRCGWRTASWVRGVLRRKAVLRASYLTPAAFILFFYRCFAETQLFVKHVPDSATEEDLRAAFERYGPLRSVKLMTNETGAHSGVAFVEFFNREDMVQAEEDTNGRLIMQVSARHGSPAPSRWRQAALAGRCPCRGSTRPAARVRRAEWRAPLACPCRPPPPASQLHGTHALHAQRTGHRGCACARPSAGDGCMARRERC